MEGCIGLPLGMSLCYNAKQGTIKEMGRSKFSPGLLIGILIATFFAISLLYRIYLPYDQVFVGNWVKFTSNDAYYHMRLVDSLVHNFPHLTRFDPYLIYPGGGNITGVFFFDWLMAVIIWVIGLGAPTQHTIDVVGVYYPAILAALTIIPAYFIGKALFHKWVGVLAAALVAILPGEFMGRSIIGWTDNHVAETFFSSVAALFVVLAIKSAGENQLSLSGLMRRDWKAARRPLIYGLLAGISLGIYLITWQGGLLFVFIISLYFIIQFMLNHLMGQTSGHLGVAGFILLLVALIIFLPLSPGLSYSLPLVVALFIPPVLAGISRLMAGRGLKSFYYPVVLVVVGVAAVFVYHVVAPAMFNMAVTQFRSVFAPGGPTAATTIEMAPFLSPSGSFSTLVAWNNFTTSFFLIKSWPIPGFAFISFGILIYLFIRQRGRQEHWLFLFVWTLVILVATLAQRRFAYYLVVNIALLSGYISWQAIWWAGLKKITERPAEAAVAKAETSKKKIKREGRGITIYHINMVLAIIVVFFFVFFWNISKSQETAAPAPYVLSDAWQSSLEWLKDNTPEPLGDPDAYYRLYEPGYQYPASAYAVTAWWDYGYWITRVAHRIPNANPAQDPAAIKRVAGLFLADSEVQARGMAEEMGSAYIVADIDMPTSKFYAVVTWAGREESRYYDTYYYQDSEGKYQIVQLLYPAYYRTLLVRLYNFDGQAVANGNPVVVTYKEVTGRDGNKYRVITDFQEFDSYQEALDYVKKEGATNHVVAGKSPFISPIPLEAVEDYELVYSSEQRVASSGNSTIPEIKIFQRIAK